MGALSDLRRRWLLILTVTAAAAGVVGGFSFTAAKHYRATALLVVAPVPAADPTFVGIDVLHDTGRTTAAATAARLVRTPEVAEAVRVRLGAHGTAAAMLRKVSTHVVGTSNTVAVDATDTSPARAAQIANGFVDAFVTARSAGFQSEVASAIGRIRQRLAELPPDQRKGPGAVQLQQQLGDLRGQLGTSDPTVRHGSEALQPSAAVWPHPIAWTIEAGLAGLGAGCLLALLAGAPARLRRRELRTGDEVATPRSERSADRLAERLERRLADRLDALAAEQAQLAAGERALAIREQEVAARAEQLRAAEAAAAGGPGMVEPGGPGAAREAELERRERELDERAALAVRRERAVAARSGELRRLEEKLDAERQQLERKREREEAASPEVDAAAAARAEELDRRERELAGQADLLARRERELAQRTEELERHESQLAEQTQRLAKEAAALEQELHAGAVAPAAPALPPPLPAVVEKLPAPPAAAAPPPPPHAPAAAVEQAPERLTAPRGGWDLHELERLVEAHAPANPHRADEWRSYLFYLRDYVELDGRVPPQFDWLVEDTFGELLAAR